MPFPTVSNWTKVLSDFYTGSDANTASDGTSVFLSTYTGGNYNPKRYNSTDGLVSMGLEGTDFTGNPTFIAAGSRPYKKSVLTYFNSNTYMATTDGTNLSVYKWGGGTSWTQHVSYVWGAGEGLDGIFHNGVSAILVNFTVTGATTEKVIYSPTGDIGSWAFGTVPAATEVYRYSSMGNDQIGSLYQNSTTVGGVPIAALEFVTNAWTTKYTYPSSSVQFWAASGDKSWIRDTSSGVVYKYTTDFSTFTAPATSDMQPFPTEQGVVFPIGYKNTAAQIHYFNESSGDWDAVIYDTITGWVLATEIPIHFFRLDNGETYMISHNTSGSINNLYKRDDNLPATANGGGSGSSENRLYVYKSDDSGVSWSSQGVYA